MELHALEISVVVTFALWIQRPYKNKGIILIQLSDKYRKGVCI